MIAIIQTKVVCHENTVEKRIRFFKFELSSFVYKQNHKQRYIIMENKQNKNAANHSLSRCKAIAIMNGIEKSISSKNQ
jgi:hypothetical protein